MGKYVDEIKGKMEEFGEKELNMNKSEEYQKIEFEIRRAKLQIERYEDELKNVDVNSLDYIETVKEQGPIKEAIEMAKENLTKYEEEKAKLDKEAESPEAQKTKNELLDEKSAYYTQTKMKYEKDLKELESKLLDAKTKQNAIKIELSMANAGMEMDETIKSMNESSIIELDEEIKSLTEEIADLKEAISLCDEQKAIVQAEFDAKVEKINEIISRNSESEEKPDEEKPDEEKPDEEKPDEEKPDEEKPDEEKPDEEKPEEVPNLPAKKPGLIARLWNFIKNKFRNFRKAAITNLSNNYDKLTAEEEINEVSADEKNETEKTDKDKSKGDMNSTMKAMGKEVEEMLKRQEEKDKFKVKGVEGKFDPEQETEKREEGEEKERR